MARQARKPDASFFQKIVIGALGARAVADDLSHQGHEMMELERGALGTKLWKDVKRKRFRIPDLVCTRCGARVECRAKTDKPELSMSHSDTEAERRWDYGMVDTDIVAFPVVYCHWGTSWSKGELSESQSYWSQRERNRWETYDYTN